jgi:uncharacterized membrane protein
VADDTLKDPSSEIDFTVRAIAIVYDFSYDLAYDLLEGQWQKMQPG